MIKKITAAALAAAIGFSVCSSPASAEDYTFDLESCTAQTECIVLGIYEGKQENADKFKAVRMLKGDIDGKYFCVDNSESLGDGFKSGSKYVLYLDKDVSVYYERDKFVPEQNIYFSADSKNNITGVTIDGVFYEESQIKTVSSLTKYTDSVMSTASEEDNFIRSKNFDTVCGESDIIARVKIGRRISDYSENKVGIYECSLVSSIKGSISENFTAVLFDGNVREGNEYYILFDEETENGNYILSSKQSIYGSNDKRF